MRVKDIKEDSIYTNNKTKRKVLKIYDQPLRVEYEFLDGNKQGEVTNCQIEGFAVWAKLEVIL